MANIDTSTSNDMMQTTSGDDHFEQQRADVETRSRSSTRNSDPRYDTNLLLRFESDSGIDEPADLHSDMDTPQNLSPSAKRSLDVFRRAIKSPRQQLN
ncbi:hypothetical protein SARC_04357 [Sphaeroforma arctica JP610]|uniref:Uncharacterized protein n=1 Tax=Sphaeroforma arctica JP610 TaxID=667725 RepID=A0A0L0G3H5_9EUKA|nr:hypothetical protein SARC_04357 [Sphaeroforma arctica JP610]KNC83391.1 hypothetical protein SARC_04357 [Sphaeroforma arctica JP610]|eukprot:XP_014157293.1 hypothetical protein SARC_04357 [Sphaeroforma arctica JP610]